METTTPEMAAANVKDVVQDNATLLKLAEDALRAWKKVFEVEKARAEDLCYYAEELWCEDKENWVAGKRKVLRGDWTVEQFDQEMEALTKKQEPVWNKLLEKTQQIRSKLEGPYNDVKTTHDRVKNSLGPHPLSKLLGKTPTSEQAELRHEYHYKLLLEFQNAEAEFNSICAYPEGLLTKIELFKENAVKENAHLTEYLHKKKGATHDVGLTPVTS